MKRMIFCTVIALTALPALALTQRDAVSIACTLGKLDAGEPELSTEDWLQACTQWMEIEPASRAIALSRRGDVYEDIGKLELALADYTASLELELGSGLTLRKRALVFARLGRTREAITDLSRHIEMLETQDSTLFNPSRSYLYRAVLIYDVVLDERLPKDRVPEALTRVRADLESYLNHPRSLNEKNRASAKDMLSQVNARLAEIQP